VHDCFYRTYGAGGTSQGTSRIPWKPRRCPPLLSIFFPFRKSISKDQLCGRTFPPEGFPQAVGLTVLADLEELVRGRGVGVGPPPRRARRPPARVHLRWEDNTGISGGAGRSPALRFVLPAYWRPLILDVPLPLAASIARRALLPWRRREGSRGHWDRKEDIVLGRGGEGWRVRMADGRVSCPGQPDGMRKTFKDGGASSLWSPGS